MILFFFLDKGVVGDKKKEKKIKSKEQLEKEKARKLRKVLRNEEEFERRKSRELRKALKK